MIKHKFVKNNKFEIFGNLGWEEFDGLFITESDNSIKVYEILTKDKWIECTEDHILYIDNKQIRAKDIKINNKIQTIDGPENVVKINIKYVKKVYNIVNTKSHKIFTNGILNHNCDEFAFVPQSQCLDGDGLIEIQNDLGEIEKITLREFYNKITNFKENPTKWS